MKNRIGRGRWNWELLLLSLIISRAGNAQLPRASVEITAKTRDSTPVPGVVIEFTPIGGPMRALTTDSAGRVEVAGVEPGTARISARKVGFRPGDLRAVLGGGRNTIPLLLDPVVVPMLNEVRILGGREVLARHSEFEGRKALGLATASITADQIHKRNPVDAWQMLRPIPSVSLAPAGGRVFAKSARTNCYMRLVVDGVPIQPRPGEPADMNDMPRPTEIHGIEVFAGPATVPPQYAGQVGAGIPGGPRICGLIMVWTK